MDVLADIVEAKRREVGRLRGRAAEVLAAAAAAPAARDFAGALRRGGEVALLAEVKRRSPSAGWIRRDADAAQIASAYAAAGAAALSVLTDAEFFGGGLQDLRTVRAAVELPLLRKDFVLDELQIAEARAAGADAVLLIVRILEPSRLAELHAAALDAGLAALVEVHDAAELETALAAGARVIGVNNRDLATFRTELSVAEALAPRVPPGVVLVAESGIRTAADVDRLGAAGVDAVLVGESLMREADVGAAARRLIGRPCAARPLDSQPVTR